MGKVIVRDGFRKCATCKIPKPLSEFGKRNNGRWYTSDCYSCLAKKRRDRTYLRKRNGLCSECGVPISENTICHKCYLCILRRKRERKRKAVEYLGGECFMCGLKTPFVSVYDFHHSNPNEKEFRISQRLRRSWKELKKELDKCKLVCANCHRIIHTEEDDPHIVDQVRTE